MSDIDIGRAWRNAFYLEALRGESRTLIPANPTGKLELIDADLALIPGGVAEGRRQHQNPHGQHVPECVRLHVRLSSLCLFNAQ